MFRITRGLPLRVRDHPVKRLNTRSLVLSGFSLRGNDKRQQQLVARAKPTALVYSIPQGSSSCVLIFQPIS